MYDLIIIGGGAAAMSSGIYAGRKKLNVAIVAAEIGGQTALQPEFYNYPGFVDVDGYKLIQNMKKQVSGLAVDFKDPWTAKRIEPVDGIFRITSATDEALEARAVLIATGGKPRRLNVPGEEAYENKGVTYCATCDAPLFGGKITAVVGGGNTGTEAALLLAKYSPKVYLLHRGPELKADAITREQIEKESKIEVLYNAITTEIIGENNRVNGLRYSDKSGEVRTLVVEGVFLAIGFLPNSAVVEGVVARNAFGEITVDPKTNMTSQAGIFAAGDVTNIPYKQTVIAAGEAAKAALAAHQWLAGQK
ncbi:MAG: FAD-dependent oxidoreductase [bacterium]|nr:FAD-dependent oxidoreductase [bacterium]